MVRPFRSETARYGEYSKAGEFVYDHPFQWGANVPDLIWQGKVVNILIMALQPHVRPNQYVAGSIMPQYSCLLDDKLDVTSTAGKIRAMQTLGVPYPEGYDKIAARI